MLIVAPGMSGGSCTWHTLITVNGVGLGWAWAGFAFRHRRANSRRCHRGIGLVDGGHLEAGSEANREKRSSARMR
jgi:hypothetical protein